MASPKTIRLKTWPKFYDAVFRGEKTFEIRKNDRDFQVGDTLELELFDPEWTDTTRPSVPPVMRYTITYITDWEQAPDMVVMGLKECDAPAPRIYTHKRLFDLVRFMRSELHEANLITDAEYGWLVGEAPLAKGQGSPSPRRLEDYDELNDRMQRYEKEMAELRAQQSASPAAADKESTWAVVADERVRHVWLHEDTGETVVVPPDFYQDNGEPSGDDGAVLTYLCTEVEQSAEKELAELRAAIEALHTTKRGSLLEMVQDLGDSLRACHAAIAADVTELIKEDIVKTALSDPLPVRLR